MLTRNRAAKITKSETSPDVNISTLPDEGETKKKQLVKGEENEFIEESWNEDSVGSGCSSSPDDMTSVSPCQEDGSSGNDVGDTRGRGRPFGRKKRRRGMKFTQFKCPSCPRKFDYMSMLKVHERIHTGEKPFECGVCGKGFAQKASLKTHENSHAGIKPFQCGYCGKTYATRANLQIHERLHSGERPFTCTVCDKQFISGSSLANHQASHSTEKSYSCDICHKMFSHRASVYTHKKNLHPNGELVPPEPICNSPQNGTPSPSNTPKKARGGSFVCQYCGKSFPYRHPLESHLRTHTGEKPFKCETCDKCFAQQASLLMHTRTHTNDRRYACETCGKRFIQAAGLKAHQRVHTGERPFKCPKCTKSFGHATSLKQHIVSHESLSPTEALMPATPTVPGIQDGVEVPTTSAIASSPQILTNQVSASINGVVNDVAFLKGGMLTASAEGKKAYVCFCGKAFAFGSVMRAHMRSHTGEKPFKCSFCDRNFAQKATLRVHERTHTGEKPYKCSFCDRRFRQLGTKSVHEKRHLGLNKTDFECGICGKIMSSASALYTHKKTHGEAKYFCSMCPKSFTVRSYLKLHLKKVHLQEVKKTFECEWCGKKFAYVASLRVHIRTHTGEKPFQCPFCPKAFASQGNLASHQRTHTGEKPYMCTICGRCFAQRSQLSSHESLHESSSARQERSKKFQCKVCGKSFGYASSLYTHKRLHTGERPYKCSYCDKRFTNQGNLQVHVRTHTGEKPYKCPACDRTYTQKGGLNVHLGQCSLYQSLKGEQPIDSSLASNVAQSELSQSLVQQQVTPFPPLPANQDVKKKKRLETLVLPKLMMKNALEKTKAPPHVNNQRQFPAPNFFGLPGNYEEEEKNNTESIGGENSSNSQSTESGDATVTDFNLLEMWRENLTDLISN